MKIWQTHRHLRVLGLYIKICSLGGVWGDQQPPIFIFGPNHISETNAARKLKNDTLVSLVVIYEYWGSI